jgi:enterochelin esterase-like enzyme
MRGPQAARLPQGLTLLLQSPIVSAFVIKLIAISRSGDLACSQEQSKMKLIKFALGLIMLTSVVFAQQGRGGRGGEVGQIPAPPPHSAEVSQDGRVTFRLSAPDATEAVVNGNWENGRGIAMIKDASGIWTVTTGPLAPELWTYTFSVDGVSMLDPGNYNIVRDGTRYMNSLLVPGPAVAFLQTGKIPHGTVSAVWYPSTGLNTNRRMVVYTPPGYEVSKTRYPFLILFHGGGGDEEAWSSMGRANVIMDNLITQGKAKPMIVVMPNATWNEPAVLDVGGPRPPQPARKTGAPPGPPGGPPVQSYDQAEREIIGDIIPFVEKNYRTIPGRENRAIAGLSMGGGISINVGLKRLDVFATVAQFSSGMFGGVGGYAPFDIEKISTGFCKDPAATNKKLKLLFFSCGKDDPRLPFQTRVVEDMRAHKINMTFNSYPGGHEWKVWRNSLADLAPMLFR